MLVLSEYVERRIATELLADRAGGVGYLLKDRVADIREFMDALRRVARGGTALDPEVVAELMIPRHPDDRLHGLTARTRGPGRHGRRADQLGHRAGARYLRRRQEKHISNIFGKLELPDSRTITDACWPC